MFFCLNARLLSGVFLLVLLSACASTPQTLQIMEYPPGDVQDQVELNQVAFFPQDEYQCGPAALATVLDYQGINVSPDDLTEKVYIPQRKGSLQLEMIATARSNGLLSYRIEPELNALLKEINHGNPVLVFQNLSIDYWPQWHYAVVIGYDLNQSELILRSGGIARHNISFSTFERTWQRAKYWAYVFVPPGEVPFTARPVNYTQASYDLQKSGHADYALKAFRQGAKKWPENSIVLMALGNAEFAADNYVNAIAAFKRELKFRKKNAAAWNNLAYSLAANNCKLAAIKAVNCASSLSPDDTNIQQSLLELQNTSVTNEGLCEEVHCPVD